MAPGLEPPGGWLLLPGPVVDPVDWLAPMIDVSQRGCWIELLLSLEPRSQEARMLCSCLPIQRRHELKHMPVDPA